MRVLSFSTTDIGGGAERVARNLHDGYVSRAHDCRFAVGQMRQPDSHTLEIDSFAHLGAFAAPLRACDRYISERPAFHGQTRLRTYLRRAAHPRRCFDLLIGNEGFSYPAPRQVLLGRAWEQDS